jgi:serine/threonine protein kinase
MKTKRQKGGKPQLVGQGAYGCGFTPALRCNTNIEHSPDVFSKLMRKNLSAEEIKSVKRIHEIDPTFKYTVYPYKSCTIKNENLRNYRNQINKCRATHKVNNARIKSEYILLQSPMGGKTLDELITRIGRNIPTNFNSFTAAIVNLFASLTNLFEGLDKMHAASYYHMDIKPNNIVLSFVNSRIIARFIDFGLSIDGSTDPSAISNVYRRSYFLWPFELRFFKNMNSVLEYGDYYMNEQIDSYYNDVVKDNIKYNQLSRIQYYDGMAPRITPNYVARIFQQITNKNKDALFLFEKTDMYSMGLLLYYILNQLTSTYFDSNTVFYKTEQFMVRLDDPYINSIPHIHIIRNFMNEFGADVYRLAFRLLSINPLERPSSKEAHMIYSRLVANIESKRHALIELPKTPPTSIVNTVKKAFARNNSLSPNAFKLPPNWNI